MDEFIHEQKPSVDQVSDWSCSCHQHQRAESLTCGLAGRADPSGWIKKRRVIRNHVSRACSRRRWMPGFGWQEDAGGLR